MSGDGKDVYTKFINDEYKTKITVTNEKFVPKSDELEKLDTSKDEKNSRKGVYPQIFSTCAVLLLSAACGMPIGYSAILLPQLSNKNESTDSKIETDIAIDIEIGSWIASVHSLATPMGALFSGPMADYIGRRQTLLLSVIPMIMGWITIAISRTHWMIIIGRVFCGYATGCLGGPAQVYIAETTESNIRSLLIGAPFVSYSLGILIVYALGSFMHWRTVAWLGNVLPIFAGLAICYIPESPAWLLRQGKTDAAYKSMTYLRGGNIVLAKKEIITINKHIDKERATTKFNENIFDLICKKEALQPLMIIIVFAFFQMCSGTFIIVFYAIDIISEFGTNFDAKTAAIWTAFVRMCCTIILCIILTFISRRRILIISGMASGVSCLVLSIYLYMMNTHATKTSTDALIAGTCMFLYIAFNTALMIMPGIMIGEILPAKIRGRTAGGVFAAMNITLFFVAKIFPIIHNAVKMSGVFMIFAIACFVVSVFMFMFQPETKGRTLEQIEDYFKENNWMWITRNKNSNTNQQAIQP